MDQLSLDFVSQPPMPPENPAPQRRIDITIERLQATVDSLSAEQQEQLAGPHWRWWSVVVTVQRLRAMERAEAEVLPRAQQTMADAYDRVVQPGEHPVEAMLKTFRAVYSKEPAHA